jgi:hypothetical protein
MISYLSFARIFGIVNKGGENTTKKMTSSAASRIQAHADRNGSNQGFKSRSQSAAARNNK